VTGQGFEIGRDGPSAVVVGVDGSDASLRAAAYAVGVCRRQRSRLVVVYVREPGGGLASMMDSTGVASAAAVRHQDDVERMLRDSRALAHADGVPVDLVVRTGDPYQVLAETAHEVRADGVVVGSSSGLGHRIAGSLAVRLVRKARWPVTVVP
jgi:nucleotide-binding universal stress UspA family protein